MGCLPRPPFGSKSAPNVSKCLQNGDLFGARAYPKSNFLPKRPTFTKPQYLQCIINILPSGNPPFTLPGTPKNSAGNLHPQKVSQILPMLGKSIKTIPPSRHSYFVPFVFFSRLFSLGAPMGSQGPSRSPRRWFFDGFGIVLGSFFNVF